MYFLIKKKNTILKVLSLLLIFHTTLFAENTHEQESMLLCNGSANELKDGDASVGKQEQVKIVMNCFGGMSMVIMVLLTSLLAAFFIRDEFTSFLE